MTSSTNPLHNLHSSAITCPAPDFLDESFLETVKDNLSEEGLFVVNLVSRSQATKDAVLLRMKKVKANISAIIFIWDYSSCCLALYYIVQFEIYYRCNLKQLYSVLIFSNFYEK